MPEEGWEFCLQDRYQSTDLIRLIIGASNWKWAVAAEGFQKGRHLPGMEMSLGEESRKETVFRGGFHIREKSKDYQDGRAHGQPGGYRLFSEKLSPHQLLKRNRQEGYKISRCQCKMKTWAPFPKCKTKVLLKWLEYILFPVLVLLLSQSLMIFLFAVWCWTSSGRWILTRWEQTFKGIWGPALQLVRCSSRIPLWPSTHTVQGGDRGVILPSAHCPSYEGISASMPGCAWYQDGGSQGSGNPHRNGCYHVHLNSDPIMPVSRPPPEEKRNKSHWAGLWRGRPGEGAMENSLWRTK